MRVMQFPGFKKNIAVLQLVIGMVLLSVLDRGECRRRGLSEQTMSSNAMNTCERTRDTGYLCCLKKQLFWVFFLLFLLSETTMQNITATAHTTRNLRVHPHAPRTSPMAACQCSWRAILGHHFLSARQPQVGARACAETERKHASAKYRC